jgi:CPA2 family monovalent cation:H+ antiporter-2
MSGVPMTRIVRRVSKERRNRYPLMQSFYAGYFKDGEDTSSERLEYLHVVALPEQAYAVNKTIEELDLAKRRVFVKALRREGHEIDTPAEQITLYANDVLVLQGKPRRVEQVEHYLLDGIK